ncbi:MAG: hypothetical protein CMP59_00990 [Flavobacteriales bacterium]|nr:hypothetical protein [Flavobacteriales bacterium]|tara:strand:- start:192 stop:1193 length:1002 start_codon:yes stop_codon:yes gene_type:complete
MQSKLQSQININPLELELDQASKLLFLGSCFAENISKKLADFKFDCATNPLGISYNPVSLFNLLERSLKNEVFDLSELNYANERYFSYELHSAFSNPNREILLKEVNEQLALQAKWIESADCLLISLGTAWVHILKKEDRLVNNCHKVASSEFDKAILSINDIVESWKSLANELEKKNPKLKILFTVSPVRHLKDGFRENQLSKSTLHLAVEEICQEYKNCLYFPSYEIMMDELRDYRFYDRDLVHPNSLAIDIIWEHFQSACLKDKSKQAILELEKLQASMAHRPFNSESNAHLSFLKKLLTDLQQFEKSYEVDLGAELEEIKNKLDQHPAS